MNRKHRVVAALIVSLLLSGAATAESFESDVTSLLEASCLRCHGERTRTPLNFEHVGFDLSDRQTFLTWQRVFDRIGDGEMPPPETRQPDANVVETAMGTLESALVDANVARRNGQRTPLRRLTRLEYRYTIEDLLHLEPGIAEALASTLPAEADTVDFDTVAANQGISPLHVRGYLDVADRAIDAALAFGPRPETTNWRIEYTKSPYMSFFHTAEILGGGITKKVDDGVAVFLEGGATYQMHSQTEGYQVAYPGRYRVTLEAYPYQAESPVTMTLFRGEMSGSAAVLNELIGTWDLPERRRVEVETFLRPGHLVAPSIADLQRPPGDYTNYFAPEENVQNYKGEGIAFHALEIEGPLFDEWPPRSTREILVGIDFDDQSQPVLTKSPYEHVVDVVASFAPRAFRRPLEEGELEAYASLAKPFLDNERPFLEAVRVPLRAVLTAPPFLYHVATPPGPRDDPALDELGLATRLSYFLWRSLPDRELIDLASAGRLSDSAVLAGQVDRMLENERSQRFISDFAGQAFRLYELNSTTPDPTLYPEYDGRLGQAMGRETELFFRELVAENLSVANLVDSDFTFLNRRLAEHYGIEDVEGQFMRRVELPESSRRGGLLTQASIHKITANGTTTSPVPRGNFVLANLLGKPAPPPPEGIEGLEPDTRGTTTIREQLDAHRSDAICNSCHRKIDPPGFALESFDPIGGFRTHYRVPGPVFRAGDVDYPGPPVDGPAVDITGTTPQGQEFAGVDEYKQLLLQNELDQVARNMIAQLLVYSTGAQVEFADRTEIDAIAARLAAERYPLRKMIREVVKSDLFGSL